MQQPPPTRALEERSLTDSLSRPRHDTYRSMDVAHTDRSASAGRRQPLVHLDGGGFYKNGGVPLADHDKDKAGTVAAMATTGEDRSLLLLVLCLCLCLASRVCSSQDQEEGRQKLTGSGGYRVTAVAVDEGARRLRAEAAAAAGASTDDVLRLDVYARCVLITSSIVTTTTTYCTTLRERRQVPWIPS